MPLFCCRFPMPTNLGNVRNVFIKQNAPDEVTAKMDIVMKILTLSKNGIPGFYFEVPDGAQQCRMCFTHSNNKKFKFHEYIEINTDFLNLLVSTIMSIVSPELIKKQGLNHLARPFTPSPTC